MVELGEGEGGGEGWRRKRWRGGGARLPFWCQQWERGLGGGTAAAVPEAAAMVAVAPEGGGAAVELARRAGDWQAAGEGNVDTFR